MNEPSTESGSSRAQASGVATGLSVRVTAAYVVLSAAWILLSGVVTVDLATTVEQAERFEMVKGVAFIVVTAALLFSMLKRHELRVDAWSREVDQARQRYRRVLESSPSAIAVQQGEHLVFANEAAARLFRAERPEQLVGRPVLELVNPVAHSAVVERTAQVIAGADFPHFARRQSVALDGTRLVFDVGIARVEWDGKPAVQVSLRDVTELERLEFEARDLTRALRIVGAVNDVLVRASSEGQLLTDLCRVVVDEGGLALAWCGLLDEAKKSLTPVARAGRSAASLDELDARWNETHAVGLGPHAVETRLGHAQVIDDIANAEISPQWRELAARHGLRSLALLPLKEGDTVIGVMGCLSSERAFFAAETRQLFEHLAENVSYSITALRIRQRAVSSEQASRTQFQEIVDNAANAIFVKDLEGRYRATNAVLEEWLGKARAELLGRTDAEVLPAAKAVERERRDGEALMAGVPMRIEERLGDRVVLTTRFLLYRDDRPTAVCGISTDVTEQVAQARALHALTAQVQTAREEEKTRIARDLHDDLGQLLTALRLSLDAVERALGEVPPTKVVNEVTDRVVDASELVKQALGRVRDIATSLRAPALDQLGLPDALAGEARSFEARTGVTCRLSVSPAVQVSASTATALFRITQEALTNVARHARAHAVEVHLDATPSGTVLRVDDDGVGFDVEAASTSLGLVGMRERAAAVGGSLAIASKPGKTAVVVSVPRGAEGGP